MLHNSQWIQIHDNTGGFQHPLLYCVKELKRRLSFSDSSFQMTLNKASLLSVIHHMQHVSCMNWTLTQLIYATHILQVTVTMTLLNKWVPLVFQFCCRVHSLLSLFIRQHFHTRDNMSSMSNISIHCRLAGKCLNAPKLL